MWEGPFEDALNPATSSNTDNHVPDMQTSCLPFIGDAAASHVVPSSVRSWPALGGDVVDGCGFPFMANTLHVRRYGSSNLFTASEKKKTVQSHTPQVARLSVRPSDRSTVPDRIATAPRGSGVISRRRKGHIRHSERRPAG